MGRIPDEIPAKSRRPVCPFDEAALTERGLRCVDLVACISRPCRVFFASWAARTFTLIL